MAAAVASATSREGVKMLQRASGQGGMMGASRGLSMFAGIPMGPPDPILGMTERFKKVRGRAIKIASVAFCHG